MRALPFLGAKSRKTCEQLLAGNHSQHYRLHTRENTQPKNGPPQDDGLHGEQQGLGSLPQDWSRKDKTSFAAPDIGSSNSGSSVSRCEVPKNVRANYVPGTTPSSIFD